MMASPSSGSNRLNSCSKTILDVLDKDAALRAVLVRTCAADHSSLHSTCRRFREILDSREFRQERSESGYAEVQAAVFTPFELYKYESNPGGFYGVDDADDSVFSESDEDFRLHYDALGRKEVASNYHTNRANLLVDGKRAGTVTFTLLRRGEPQSSNNNNFHHVADQVSADLFDTALLFFNKKGRPRLKSVKAVLEENDKRGFLYIEGFYIEDPAYRTTSYLTGAKALSSLLNSAPLQDRWAVAVYTPEASAQFTDGDRIMADKRSNLRTIWRHAATGAGASNLEAENEESSITETLKDQSQEWQLRCENLVKQDMRQFFGAGFVQAKETIYESDKFYLFAVPSSLESPLLSPFEMESIVVAEKPQSRPGPTGDELQFVSMIRSFCSQRRAYLDEVFVAKQTLDSPRNSQIPSVRRLLQQLDAALAQFHTTAAQSRDVWDRTDREAANIRGLLNSIVTDNILETVTQEEKNEFKVNLASLVNQLMQLMALPEEERIGLEVSADEQSDANFLHQCSQIVDEVVSERRHEEEEKLSIVRRQCQETERDLLNSIDRICRENVEKSEKKLLELDCRVRSETEKAVKKLGAGVIVKTDAIHACACKLETEYVKLMLSFIPEDKRSSALNGIDRHGQTALMAAASSTHYSSLSIGLRLQTCQNLVELGASKDIIDVSGESALGKFRRTFQKDKDRFESIGVTAQLNPRYAAQIASAPAMESFLRPFAGATDADDAYIESDEDDEDDDDSEDEGSDSDIDEDSDEDDSITEE